MPSDSHLNKRWSKYLLSRRLQELRRLRGFSQPELSRASGISESQIRNFEQMKSFPKDGAIDAIAKALEVQPECLKVLDVGDGWRSTVDQHQNYAIRACWQLADIYGLMPGYNEDYVYLSPTSTFMKISIERWAKAFQEYAFEGMDSPRYRDYELWKYEFHEHYDESEFPKRYPDWDPKNLADPQAWEKHCFSEKLSALRKKVGLTQKELGREAGIPEFTIRSYEQGKRLPKLGQVKLLAAALGIEWESLVFFDLGSPNLAMQTLFVIANSYGLRPDIQDGLPMVRSTQPGLERAIENWARATQSLAGEELEDWCNHYQDDSPEAWSAVKTRYKRAWVKNETGTSSPIGMESDFDPYPQSEIRA